MLVVPWTVFGQNPFSIRSHDGVDVGSVIATSILDEKRLVGTGSKYADGGRFLVLDKL